MLANRMIKTPVFTGFECRLTFLTPRDVLSEVGLQRSKEIINGRQMKKIKMELHQPSAKQPSQGNYRKECS